MTGIAFRTARPPVVLLAGCVAALWVVAWLVNLPAATWIAFEVLGLARGSQLGEAVAFFVYDVPKVLLLLSAAITVVSFLRTFISPERVRHLLAGRRTVPGTIAAAGVGAVTPFCSCSSVPLFSGFVEAGVPLGVTFAFLVASPLVGPVPIILIWGLFGPLVALAYVVSGLTVAIAAGLVIGRLGLERHVEDYVWKIRMAPAMTGPSMSFEDRLRDAWSQTTSIVRRVFPFVVVGIAIGAAIHGFVPEDVVVAVGGPGNPLAVPALVLLGVPLYLDAAGTLPIVEALVGKGLPLGSALAFMMAVVGLSLPELVILRRVLKPRLIAVFVAVVASGIVLVGSVLNALFA
jgi:uncharacterized membrane protein YraQ (UPF0718 family)